MQKIKPVKQNYNKKQYRHFVNNRYKEMKKSNFYEIQSKKFMETFIVNDHLNQILKPFKKLPPEKKYEAFRFYMLKNHLKEISKPLISDTPLPLFFLKMFYYIEFKIREFSLLKLSKKIINNGNIS